MAATSVKLSVADMMALMAGMREHGVAALEWDGVKLALTPPERSAGGVSSASNIVQRPAPELTAAQAHQAIKAAQFAAQGEAEKKLRAQQERTAAARTRAAGGISSGLEKTIAGIYEDSKRAPVLSTES
jgi:hypothetical protein